MSGVKLAVKKNLYVFTLLIWSSPAEAHSGGLCSDEARQWLASDSQLELKSTLDMLASLNASELLWLTWVL